MTFDAYSLLTGLESLKFPPKRQSSILLMDGWVATLLGFLGPVFGRRYE